jgi:hypothetical protein
MLFVGTNCGMATMARALLAGVAMAIDGKLDCFLIYP